MLLFDWLLPVALLALASYLLESEKAYARGVILAAAGKAGIPFNDNKEKIEEVDDVEIVLENLTV